MHSNGDQSDKCASRDRSRAQVAWLIVALACVGLVTTWSIGNRLRDSQDVPAEVVVAQSQQAVPAAASAARVNNQIAQDYYCRGERELKVGNLQMAAVYFEQALIRKPDSKAMRKVLERVRRSQHCR